MSEASLRLIKKCIEWREFINQEVEKIPHNTRGIYVLFEHEEIEPDVYNVMYIGMSATGVRSRLQSHIKSRTKSTRCSRFSIFEVHDNVSEQEIEELEGIIRHMFRKDSHGNQLAKQVRFEKLIEVRKDD